MIEVAVSRLGLDSSTNSFVVILEARGGTRILPIWIGRAEAESIAAHLNGVPSARPMTHDLARALIVTLGGTLQRVHITRVEDATFYAELHLTRSGEQFVVDARPSDSIALALRFGAPIFASDALLAEHELPSASSPDGGGNSESDASDDADADADAEVTEGGFPPTAPDAELSGAQLLQRHLERLRPEDFGKFTL